MPLPQASSTKAVVATTAQIVRKTASIVYGVLETAIGATFFLSAPVIGGIFLFDGIRRLYREAPHNVKRFLSRSLTGKEPAPGKPAGQRSFFSHFADIAIGAGVLFTGLGIFSLAAFIASLGAAASHAVAVPLMAGLALAAGGLASVTHRFVSFLKGRVLGPSKKKDQHPEPVVPPAESTQGAALSGMKVKPAFSKAANENNKEAAHDRKMHPRPLSPGLDGV